MPKTYPINLSEAQRHELEVARNGHPLAYVRERAAGILKVANGCSLRQVAYVGLLRRHAPETVKEWCERYLAEGLTGLLVREGRGRKPCFFSAK
jgi:transposase